MEEKSLTLKIEDIPDKVRLVLKKGVQKRLILKCQETFKRKELAQKLKVDESTIFHWKREDYHMKLGHLKKLLRLSRIFNLETFARKIGFIHPLQQNKLINLLKKMKNQS